MLRESWGDNAPAKFRIVFGMNAFLVFFFSLPLFAVLVVGASQPTWLLAAGVGFGWFAMLGESLSDRQLQQWRSNPENKGKTCRQGLWRYSRHPNYFGEFLIWWAFFLISVSTGAWWAVIGPAIMTILLLKVSGVGLMEKGMTNRRPEYQSYIDRTNTFFPWVPKKQGASDMEAMKS